MATGDRHLVASNNNVNDDAIYPLEHISQPVRRVVRRALLRARLREVGIELPETRQAVTRDPSR